VRSYEYWAAYFDKVPHHPYQDDPGRPTA
jgi:hypothetical protein